ncbi:unnamed protein product [Protopolystoma xenopodis]|uniref:H15 domain-containing protein n=1 Tax=Protopolystoma xenopodis TaxID=117903 RepID=A0A3S4ZW99_9PLAT|nr:unnamed protein product [Protopolystoma xenopodis]
MSAAAESAAAKKASKPALPKVTAAHPPVLDMVRSAIISAYDRKGSSLATIKKHIAANYKVDVEKLGPHIRRCITHAVDKGVLARVGNKGKGASGSFKVAERSTKPKVAKPKTPKKGKAPKPKGDKKAKSVKPKVSKPKKAKTPSKPKAEKKAKELKRVKTPKMVKTPKPKPAKKVKAAHAKPVKKPLKKTEAK